MNTFRKKLGSKLFNNLKSDHTPDPSPERKKLQSSSQASLAVGRKKSAPLEENSSTRPRRLSSADSSENVKIDDSFQIDLRTQPSIFEIVHPLEQNPSDRYVLPAPWEQQKKAQRLMPIKRQATQLVPIQEAWEQLVKYALSSADPLFGQQVYNSNPFTSRDTPTKQEDKQNKKIEKLLAANLSDNSKKKASSKFKVLVTGPADSQALFRQSIADKMPDSEKYTGMRVQFKRYSLRYFQLIMNSFEPLGFTLPEDHVDVIQFVFQLNYKTAALHEEEIRGLSSLWEEPVVKTVARQVLLFDKYRDIIVYLLDSIAFWSKSSFVPSADDHRIYRILSRRVQDITVSVDNVYKFYETAHLWGSAKQWVSYFGSVMDGIVHMYDMDNSGESYHLLNLLSQRRAICPVNVFLIIVFHHPKFPDEEFYLGEASTEEKLKKSPVYDEFQKISNMIINPAGTVIFTIPTANSGLDLITRLLENCKLVIYKREYERLVNVASGMPL